MVTLIGSFLYIALAGRESLPTDKIVIPIRVSEDSYDVSSFGIYDCSKKAWTTAQLSEPVPMETCVSGGADTYFAASYLSEKLYKIWKQGDGLVSRTFVDAPITDVSSNGSDISFLRGHEVWLLRPGGAGRKIAGVSDEVRNMSPKFERAWYSSSFDGSRGLFLNYVDPYRMNGDAIYYVGFAGGKPRKLLDKSVLLASSNSGLFACTDPDHKILRIYKMDHGKAKLVAKRSEPKGEIYSAAFDSSGDWFGVSRDGFVTVYGAGDLKERLQVKLPKLSSGMMVWNPMVGN